MGVFDSAPDRPGQIRVEGQEITLKFDRTGPTTARVSWNIPPPANGCTAETQAYCGIIVTLDTQPASTATAPANGTLYTADRTGDRDLHAGDKIGTALVVGAFYEGEKKGTGEDFTTFFDVTGLEQNAVYYVAGYAVDCTRRYHREGTFAYSQPFGGEGTPNTSGSQRVILSGGANLTDGTGLDSGNSYFLGATIDGIDYTFNVNGINAQTYEDLIDTLNDQFGKATGAPQSASAPNTGVYWITGSPPSLLYQWDGTQLVEIPVLLEPTDPTALAIGDYWYDTSIDTLKRWNGVDWDNVSTVISFNKDLTDPTELSTSVHWFNPGSDTSPIIPPAAYERCGNNWCKLNLYNQTEDPSVNGITFNCNTYWYNPETMFLQQWSEELCAWVGAEAIYWDVDPTNLEDETYWFDDDDELLYQLGTPLTGVWNLLGFGYQDIFLNGTTAPYTLDDLAFVVAGSPYPGSPVSGSPLTAAEGVYRDTIVVNGNAIELEINICNETDATFRKVFEKINQQLAIGSPETAQASIGFRTDQTGNAIRITSTTPSPPQIQPGGNLFSSLVDFSSLGTSTTGATITVSETEPTSPVSGNYWVVPSTQELFIYGGAPLDWQPLCSIFFSEDPTDIASCELWWDSNNDILYAWDAVNSQWKQVDNFFQQETDPTLPPTLTTNDVWYNGTTLQRWDGTEWLEVSFVVFSRDPTVPMFGDVWFNPDTGKWYEWSTSPTGWVEFDPVESTVSPAQNDIPSGTFWYDTANNQLFRWNGTNWISIMFTTDNPTPAEGDLWYDTSNDVLNRWDGSMWVESSGVATIALDIEGNLIITSATSGSLSHVILDGYASLLNGLTLYRSLEDPVCGTDGLNELPSYAVEGIGTDGSTDEIRDIAHAIRMQLGYPVIEVELTKEQLDKSVQVAIEELRRNSAVYRRGFMKLNIVPGIQRYVLSNKTPGIIQPDGTETGYDHVVQVMGVFRVTSAFMTSAHGSGIFGQVVLQHLYNMGTFDLLSYHLVSQYIEQLEHLFASRLTFSWNETNRTLWLHQVFSHRETAVMDVAVERTIQDLLTDRFTKRWIERYALAHARMTLAEIRGKFSTLPGAGGNISLNAADLMTKANEEMEKLQAEIDNYVVSSVEEFGQHCEFIIG